MSVRARLGLLLAIALVVAVVAVVAGSPVAARHGRRVEVPPALAAQGVGRPRLPLLTAHPSRIAPLDRFGPQPNARIHGVTCYVAGVCGARPCAEFAVLRANGVIVVRGPRRATPSACLPGSRPGVVQVASG